MDFGDLEQEELARGLAETPTGATSERAAQHLNEIRIGSTVRVSGDADAVVAACARAGIGPVNCQQARAAAGLAVKVLEKDADRTVRCAVPSVGHTWFALEALSLQACSVCGCPLVGAVCDRCGRRSPQGFFAHSERAPAEGSGEGPDAVWGEGVPEERGAELSDAQLEAEIERRVCVETEIELAEAGGVLGGLLQVELSEASQPSGRQKRAAKVYFADAINRCWPSCAKVFMDPEPSLTSLGHRITSIFKLVTVFVHLRFRSHARAHVQTFLDVLTRPRTGLCDVVGRWLGVSSAERSSRASEFQASLDHKLRTLLRSLELALACCQVTESTTANRLKSSLDQLSRLVSGDAMHTKGAATWEHWQVSEPDGAAPVPSIECTGQYTVEVWGAGSAEANGVYAVTLFDKEVKQKGGNTPSFTSDSGSAICEAYGMWWLVRGGRALYATCAPLPVIQAVCKDEWFSRPFPMMRGTPLVKVSLGASTRLLAELRAAYADPGFQEEYQQLRASGGGHVPYTVSVQAKILPKHGFEGTLEGVLEMRRHTSFWCAGDPPTQKLLRDIHSLLEYGQPFTAPTHEMSLESDAAEEEASTGEANTAYGNEEAGEQRWVLVRPVNGLCNRLCAIVAAWLLAKDLGRRLAVDWQCMKCCNCPLERLMAVPEDICLVTPRLLQQSRPLQVGLDLLEHVHSGSDTTYKAPERPRGAVPAEARDFQKIACGFSCGPAGYADVDSPEWQALPRLWDVPLEELPLLLQLPCVSVLGFDDFYPARDLLREALAERSALLNCLRPAPWVTQLVLELPPGTTGVHVRRSDHWEACTFSPENLFVEKMEDILARSGGSRTFFLATDDPGVEERLRRRFREHLFVLPKRTLDRSTPEGIEDAFADLLTLAQCAEIIGSFESTFSRTAGLFQCVPLTVVYRDTRTGPVRPAQQ